MKLKIVGPAVGLFLLVGSVGVSAASNSNNGIPEQIIELQSTVSNLVNEVTDLLPLKDDVKTVKDQLATANTTISQQQTEIDTMKKEIADLKSSSSSSVGTLTLDVNGVSKELSSYINSHLWIIGDASMTKKMNLTDQKMVEKNGEYVYQVYFTGDYGWTSNDSLSPGKYFATGLANELNIVNTLYHTNVKLEIYENNNQITSFIQ